MHRFFAIAAAMCLLASIGAAQEPKLVKLYSVSAGNQDIERQFFGHVVAKATVDLAFQVSGQIIEFPVVEGEPVAAGAVIARLDQEPFELALDQARVQKDQADRTLERLRKLQGNAVSQVTVDDAETQAKLTEIALRDAERSFRNATLLAPFDALVASRNVPNFSSTAAGTPVVRLHDMSDLRIEIDVPEVLFLQAGENPDVEVWAVFPSRDTRYPLEPREFNAETSAVGQTFRITLGMAPPEDLVILPGASVTVFAVLRGAQSGITVPGSAIISQSDGTAQVMVFTSDDGDVGTVAPVTVDITPGPSGEIRVTSGLEEGQEIVASGAHLLTAGDAVKRFAGFGN